MLHQAFQEILLGAHVPQLLGQVPFYGLQPQDAFLDDRNTCCLFLGTCF